MLTRGRFPRVSTTPARTQNRRRIASSPKSSVAQPPTGPRLDLGEIRQSGGKRVQVWAILAQDFSLAGFVSNEFEIEWPPKVGHAASRSPRSTGPNGCTSEEARERLVRGQADFIDRLLDRSILDLIRTDLGQ